jgi:hypothetical protein
MFLHGKEPKKQKTRGGCLARRHPKADARNAAEAIYDKAQDTAGEQGARSQGKIQGLIQGRLTALSYPGVSAPVYPVEPEVCRADM